MKVSHRRWPQARSTALLSPHAADRGCSGQSFQSRRTAAWEVTVQEAPRHVQRFPVLRLHGVQRYSSDQLVQCWTPSRHSDLGTQAQYS